MFKASSAGPSLEDRITELESRVAFQELTLSELSDALAEARMESARTSEQLVRALGDLKQLRGLLYADPGVEPPPPHY
ncbi:MAG TPA: SlyX family protein [Arenimonas sp.]|uniref:SlyX family protein n=1 Tax=Arenimonas sp. TaxID=1872635 RepID=UPI002D7E6CDC|nr:SlyX family protein [Arenimonas sp.]HEU0152939.1 SlyX family protein [Arenimonas sp.]